MMTANFVSYCSKVSDSLDWGYNVTMKIEGSDVTMQVDTGAAVTVIPGSRYAAKLGQVPCEPCRAVIKTYTGDRLPVEGKCHLFVVYRD